MAATAGFVAEVGDGRVENVVTYIEAEKVTITNRYQRKGVPPKTGVARKLWIRLPQPLGSLIRK